MWSIYNVMIIQKEDDILPVKYILIYTGFIKIWVSSSLNNLGQVGWFFSPKQKMAIWNGLTKKYLVTIYFLELCILCMKHHTHSNYYFLYS